MKRALLLGMLAACGGTPGKMKVDSPSRPYQPPDIGDLTGAGGIRAGYGALTCHKAHCAIDMLAAASTEQSPCDRQGVR